MTTPRQQQAPNADVAIHLDPPSPSEFSTRPLSADEQAANERLARQESLKLNLPKGVAIVGCGGVGSWAAYFLALAGVDHLWLFDPDTVSIHNLNRLLLPLDSVGKSKSDALATAITGLRPTIKCIPLGSFSTDLASSMALYDEVSWIVCSTDTLRSRRMVYDWSHSQKVNYIEAAAEAESGSIAATPADFATPDEEKPGYASVPVWVGPCVHAAAFASSYVLRQNIPHKETSCRLDIDLDTFAPTFTSHIPETIAQRLRLKKKGVRRPTHDDI